MQSNYWCSQCPWQDSCVGPQGYYPAVYKDNYRFNGGNEEDESPEIELDEQFDEEFEQEAEDFGRAPRDVNRVIGLINRRAVADINEIVRIGVNRRLLDYMIRTLVTYLDRNYNRYTGPLQRRVEEATRDIRRDFPWIADIMRIFGISPAIQGRLFDEIVRTSMRNLRETTPTPPPPRPPVGPGPRED